MLAGMSGPRVVIVHDYLNQLGGAERVVLSMLRAFPGSRVVTSVYAPERTYDEFREVDIEALWPNRIGAFTRDQRRAFPVLRQAFSRHLIEDADVVLCSSSGWAHGVQAGPARKLVYCYTPARWLYDSDRYTRESSRIERSALAALKPGLIRWDRAAMRTADDIAAISSVVAERVNETYGWQPRVLAPPMVLDADGPTAALPGVEPGYLLVVSRLLSYKRVDLLLDAMRRLTEHQLLVVGAGPDAERLRGLAPANVTFRAGLSEAELRWAYANARVLLSAAHEDFGLTPVEANAFGVPAAVVREAGFLDTMVEGKNGMFFPSLDPTDIADTVRAVLDADFETHVVRAHAARYSETSFMQELRDWAGVDQ